MKCFKAGRHTTLHAWAALAAVALAAPDWAAAEKPVASTNPIPAAQSQTEFGRHRHVEYLPGDLPVILSAPHGGREKPEDIPDRKEGTFAFDTNTQELARAIAEAFHARTGKRPHVVICLLHRRKVDCNRDVGEAAAGHPLAVAAWEDYQAFLDRARADVVKRFGKGLFIDLHGHGHAEQQLELGYLLNRDTLGRDDAALDEAGVVASSSLRALAQKEGVSHASLIRGPRSLGGLLEAEGFPSTPSPRNPKPAAPYFNGGYNTVRHGRNAAPVFGLQIETNSKGVRDTAESREKFAGAFVTAVITFLKEQAEVELQKTSEPNGG